MIQQHSMVGCRRDEIGDINLHKLQYFNAHSTFALKSNKLSTSTMKAMTDKQICNSYKAISNHPIGSEILMKNSFHYTGVKDYVACCDCGVEIQYWPLAVQRSPLLLKRLHAYKCPRGYFAELATKNSWAHFTTCHQRYEMFETSFQGALKVRNLTTPDHADSGFFLTRNYVTKCVYCNIDVDNWRKCDVVDEEHLKWSQQKLGDIGCPYVATKLEDNLIPLRSLLQPPNEYESKNDTRVVVVTNTAWSFRGQMLVNH